MARITKNERYDESGQWVTLFRPAFPESRKMPNWWIELGPEIQAHGEKLYYKGAEITEIDNFDPQKIEPSTDPMTIEWALTMEDGTYAVYKPESQFIAEALALAGSELWAGSRKLKRLRE